MKHLVNEKILLKRLLIAHIYIFTLGALPFFLMGVAVIHFEVSWEFFLSMPTIVFVLYMQLLHIYVFFRAAYHMPQNRFIHMICFVLIWNYIGVAIDIAIDELSWRIVREGLTSSISSALIGCGLAGVMTKRSSFEMNNLTEETHT